jgi:hypothetical protein
MMYRCMARLSQGNRTEQRVLSYEGYHRNASWSRLLWKESLNSNGEAGHDYYEKNI